MMRGRTRASTWQLQLCGTADYRVEPLWMIASEAAEIASWLRICVESFRNDVRSKGARFFGTTIVLPGGTCIGVKFQNEFLTGWAWPFGRTMKIFVRLGGLGIATRLPDIIVGRRPRTELQGSRIQHLADHGDIERPLRNEDGIPGLHEGIELRLHLKYGRDRLQSRLALREASI